MIVLRLYSISRLLLFYAFLFEIGILSVWRIVFYKLITQYRKAGFNFRNIIIVGNKKRAKQLSTMFNSQNDFGYKINCILSNDTFSCDVNVYNITEFKKVIDENKPDEIFYSLTFKDILKRKLRLTFYRILPYYCLEANLLKVWPHEA